MLSNWESKICQDACILEKPCILIFKFTRIWIISYLKMAPSHIAAPAYPGDHNTCTYKLESTLSENASTRVQLFWPICFREDKIYFLYIPIFKKHNDHNLPPGSWFKQILIYPTRECYHKSSLSNWILRKRFWKIVCYRFLCKYQPLPHSSHILPKEILFFL